MSIEAMKQALNFILATGEHDQRCGAFDLDEEGRHCACTCGLRKTIDALRTAIEQAKKQEPVAWMYPGDLERFQTSETFAQAYSIEVVSPLAGKTVPLYTTPPAAPVQEENLYDLAKQADNWGQP